MPAISSTHPARENSPVRRWRTRRPDEIVTNTWDDRIEQILASDEDDAEKSKKLLELWPNLPVDNQVEAAVHLNHLVPDEDYPLLGPHLVDSRTPEPVLDTLLAGLLARPDAIKLPLLLGIAQDQEHPRHEQALEFLDGLMGQTYTNWDQRMTDVMQRLGVNSGQGTMTDAER